MSNMHELEVEISRKELYEELSRKLTEAYRCVENLVKECVLNPSIVAKECRIPEDMADMLIRMSSLMNSLSFRALVESLSKMMRPLEQLTSFVKSLESEYKEKDSGKNEEYEDIEMWSIEEECLNECYNDDLDDKCYDDCLRRRIECAKKCRDDLYCYAECAGDDVDEEV